VPVVAVLAVPTRPAGDVAELLATPPVAVEGLLAREGARGEAGELVSVPVPGEGPLERVLLAGTGAATPADLRRTGAGLARRAKGAASLAIDLRALALDEPALRALADGLLLASYSFTLKPSATPSRWRPSRWSSPTRRRCSRRSTARSPRRTRPRSRATWSTPRR
jgi:leucyl aminopeptidase